MERGFMNIWKQINHSTSITTVLSIRDKKGLHEWRKKVGEEVGLTILIRTH